MTTTLAVSAALVLDALLGEPRRFHPLIGFGRLATALERRLYADSIPRGMVAAGLLLVPFTLFAALPGLVFTGPGVVAFDVLCLYLALGGRSLAEHARQVREALTAGDLATARERVGRMVSRDTADLDREGVARAAVESVLENGNDAVFGALFWFVAAGAPGVVLYRLANTLDAMWGYRSARYVRFGRACARLDDLLNYLPARLTALAYAATGAFQRALHCWRCQGRAWKSPNAGAVMAAGAGSLGLQLGGPARYQGVTHERPPLGEGRPPEATDIERALRLVRRTTILWLLALFAGETLVGSLF